MRNNRGPRRREREFGRDRDYELRQGREQGENRGRYDWEWRPGEDRERMSEGRRGRQGQYSQGGRYEEREFMPEYEDRQRWDREDWGNERQYRGSEERYGRSSREYEDQGFENYPERERYGRGREYEYENEGTRRMNYGGPEEYGRRQSEGRQSEGRNFRRFQGGQNSGMNRRGQGNGGSSRSQGNGGSNSGWQGNEYGFGERYSSSDRFGGQEYFDGQAGNWDRFSGREQTWTGSNSPQFGESWQSRQNFSGKGPRGYQRSDDRIKEDINESLKEHPEIDATEITVQVSQGQVTLTGSVDDRYAKRLAEDTAEEISGVKDVQNQIRVLQASETGQFGPSGTGMLSTSRTGKESGKETSKERLGTTSA